MVCFFPRFIGPIMVDVVLKEGHTRELAITKNPVELGADVADHAYVEPAQLRIHGAIDSFSTDPTLLYAFPGTRVAMAYQAMVAIQQMKEPFVVISGLDIYRDMLIKRINVERDKSNSTILEFDCDLEQVIIVESGQADGGGGGGGQGAGGGAAGDGRGAAPSQVDTGSVPYQISQSIWGA
jgi:hypothetical protein